MRQALVLEDYEVSRELLCDSLHHAFEAIEIRETDSVAGARRLLAHHRFDLALLDLNLPDGSGIEVIRQIRRSGLDTFCVVATVCDDSQSLFECLRAGANGYLLKHESRRELVTRLRGIAEGHPPLSPAVAQKMIAYFSTGRGQPETAGTVLTGREREVLRLLAMGNSRKSIAASLGISVHTANDHVKALYRKLKVSSGAEATRVACQRGLL